MNASADAIFALVLLVAAPMAMVALLRWAGMTPGPAAIMGGIGGGILLGSLVLGRVRPEIQERLFLGGVQERQQLDHLVRLHGAEELAARAAGLSPADRREADRKFEQDRSFAESDLRQARFRDQSLLRLFAAALAIAVSGGIVLRWRGLAAGLPAAQWCAAPLVAAALVRADLEHLWFVPIAALLAGQFLILRFTKIRSAKASPWICLAIMCGLAAWDHADESATVLLILLALMTEAMAHLEAAGRIAMLTPEQAVDVLSS